MIINLLSKGKMLKNRNRKYQEFTLTVTKDVSQFIRIIQ